MEDGVYGNRGKDVGHDVAGCSLLGFFPHFPGLFFFFFAQDFSYLGSQAFGDFSTWAVLFEASCFVLQGFLS